MAASSSTSSSAANTVSRDDEQFVKKFPGGMAYPTGGELLPDPESGRIQPNLHGMTDAWMDSGIPQTHPAAARARIRLAMESNHAQITAATASASAAAASIPPRRPKKYDFDDDDDDDDQPPKLLAKQNQKNDDDDEDTDDDGSGSEDEEEMRRQDADPLYDYMERQNCICIVIPLDKLMASARCLRHVDESNEANVAWLANLMIVSHLVQFPDYCLGNAEKRVSEDSARRYFSGPVRAENGTTPYRDTPRTEVCVEVIKNNEKITVAYRYWFYLCDKEMDLFVGLESLIRLNLAKYENPKTRGSLMKLAGVWNRPYTLRYKSVFVDTYADVYKTIQAESKASMYHTSQPYLTKDEIEAKAKAEKAAAAASAAAAAASKKSDDDFDENGAHAQKRKRWNADEFASDDDDDDDDDEDDAMQDGHQQQQQQQSKNPQNNDASPARNIAVAPMNASNNNNNKAARAPDKDKRRNAANPYVVYAPRYTVEVATRLCAPDAKSKYCNLKNYVYTNALGFRRWCFPKGAEVYRLNVAEVGSKELCCLMFPNLVPEHWPLSETHPKTEVMNHQRGLRALVNLLDVVNGEFAADGAYELFREAAWNKMRASTTPDEYDAWLTTKSNPVVPKGVREWRKDPTEYEAMQRMMATSCDADKARARFFDEQIKRGKTFMDYQIWEIVDRAAGPFANLVQWFMIQLEEKTNCHFLHSYVLVAWICSQTMSDMSFEALRNHLFLSGEASSGKSWLLRLIEKMLCPGVVLNVTTITERTFTTEGEIRNRLLSFDETPPSVLGQDESGRQDGTGNAIIKAMISTCKVTTLSINVENGRRKQTFTTLDVRSAFMGAYNTSSAEAAPPMRARLMMFEVMYVHRPGKNAVDRLEDVKTVQAVSATPEAEKLYDTMRWMSYFIDQVNKHIDCGKLPPVDMRIAESYFPEWAAKCKALGFVSDENRDSLKFYGFVRQLVKFDAVAQAFFWPGSRPNPETNKDLQDLISAHRESQKRGFSLGEIQRVEPFLTCTDEHAIWALGALMPMLIDVNESVGIVALLQQHKILPGKHHDVLARADIPRPLTDAKKDWNYVKVELKIGQLPVLYQQEQALKQLMYNALPKDVKQSEGSLLAYIRELTKRTCEVKKRDDKGELIQKLGDDKNPIILETITTYKVIEVVVDENGKKTEKTEKIETPIYDYETVELPIMKFDGPNVRILEEWAIAVADPGYYTDMMNEIVRFIQHMATPDMFVLMGITHIKTPDPEKMAPHIFRALRLQANPQKPRPIARNKLLDKNVPTRYIQSDFNHAMTSLRLHALGIVERTQDVAPPHNRGSWWQQVKEAADAENAKAKLGMSTSTKTKELVELASQGDLFTGKFYDDWCNETAMKIRFYEQRADWADMLLVAKRVFPKEEHEAIDKLPEAQLKTKLYAAMQAVLPPMPKPTERQITAQKIADDFKTLTLKNFTTKQTPRQHQPDVQPHNPEQSPSHQKDKTQSQQKQQQQASSSADTKAEASSQPRKQHQGQKHGASSAAAASTTTAATTTSSSSFLGSMPKSIF